MSIKSDHFDPRDFLGIHGARHVADHPEKEMCDLFGLTQDALHKSIVDAGLSYMMMCPDDLEERYGAARENWLYVYDKNSLQGFLDENRKTLEEAKWPTIAEDFIFHMSYVQAPWHSKMYDLISASYGRPLSTAHAGLLETGRRFVSRDLFYNREESELTVKRYQAMRQNDPVAAQYIIDKAKSGNFVAMCDASKLYEHGRGVEKNPVEAAFWDGLTQRIRRDAKMPEGIKDAFSRNAKPAFRLDRQQQDQVRQRIEVWCPVTDVTLSSLQKIQKFVHRLIS